jgi:hypothetical protein
MSCGVRSANRAMLINITVADAIENEMSFSPALRHLRLGLLRDELRLVPDDRYEIRHETSVSSSATQTFRRSKTGPLQRYIIHPNYSSTLPPARRVSDATDCPMSWSGLKPSVRVTAGSTASTMPHWFAKITHSSDASMIRSSGVAHSFCGRSAGRGVAARARE